MPHIIVENQDHYYHEIVGANETAYIETVFYKGPKEGKLKIWYRRREWGEDSRFELLEEIALNSSFFHAKGMHDVCMIRYVIFGRGD